MGLWENWRSFSSAQPMEALDCYSRISPKMTRTEMLTFNLTCETDEKIRLSKFINNVLYCKMSRSIFGLLLLNIQKFLWSSRLMISQCLIPLNNTPYYEAGIEILPTYRWNQTVLGSKNISSIALKWFNSGIQRKRLSLVPINRV